MPKVKFNSGKIPVPVSEQALSIFMSKIKFGLESTEKKAPGRCWHFPEGKSFLYDGYSTRPEDFAWVNIKGIILYWNDEILRRCKNDECCNPEHLYVKVKRRRNRKYVAPGFKTKNIQTLPRYNKEDLNKFKYLLIKDSKSDHIFFYHKSKILTLQSGQKIMAQKMLLIVLYGENAELVFVSQCCDAPFCLNPAHLKFDVLPRIQKYEDYKPEDKSFLLTQNSIIWESWD